MMLVYNKDKQLIETLVEDFKTSNPPYKDYICVIESYSNPRFFQIDEVTMNTRYDEGAYGTGSRSKHLTMHTTSGDKLVFEYYVHTWDGLYAEWDQGTYNLKYNGNFYEYSAIWVGSSYNPYLNYNKGTLTIKESGSKKIFDFDIDCDESIYGHCEASY